MLNADYYCTLMSDHKSGHHCLHRTIQYVAPFFSLGLGSTIELVKTTINQHHNQPPPPPPCITKNHLHCITIIEKNFIWRDENFSFHSSHRSVLLQIDKTCWQARALLGSFLQLIRGSNQKWKLHQSKGHPKGWA